MRNLFLPMALAGASLAFAAEVDADVAYVQEKGVLLVNLMINFMPNIAYLAHHVNIQ